MKSILSTKLTLYLLLHHILNLKNTTKQTQSDIERAKMYIVFYFDGMFSTNLLLLLLLLLLHHTMELPTK